MERGREQPPGLDRASTPTPRPEGCSRPDVRAGMLANSRCDLRTESTRVITRERAVDTSRNALHFSTTILARNRPHNDQDRAVLGIVKALAALDPPGCGLDDASAQLEVALM
jgi:hypothetical protein